MQTSFIDSPVSVVNFSPNERVSDCVALEIETASRLWYVITLKLANLPTTYVLHISSANVRLEPRAKTVRFFGPIAVSRRNGLQFNELFESCRLPKRGQVVHIFREENSFKKPASRSIERPKKKESLYIWETAASK